ncbi:glycosyltransferase [Pseudarthrobacter oxydans]|uniref:glycosyltransferase n=1 Tax=Pseudarthrobacter oxydans TaxID=1671 RepID=UPI0037F1F882
MAKSWNISDDSLWVTFDSHQSRSVLAGKHVLSVPYVAPRDLRSVMSARRLIDQKVKNESFDHVVSTGAGLALAAFTSGQLRKVPKTYIESVSRTVGPSLTGKIVSILGLANLYTQHENWANRRWTHTPGVLEEFRTVQSPQLKDQLRLFVTLGTIKPYRFDSLIDAVLGSGLADDNTVWQVGETIRKDLPGKVVAHMTASEFQENVTQADTTITHAGVGTILQLLESGVCPVVVPRDPNKNEHVDGHQRYICDLLKAKGLGIVRDPENLSREDILLASMARTVPA